VQFLSENRLNGCQIFGRFGYKKKPNQNRILVFGTSLALRLLVAVTLANHYDVALNCE